METAIIKDVKWIEAAPVTAFPKNGGACVLINGEQIAIFNFTEMGKWFASQNKCTHKMEMVLSRGIIGDSKGTPKVACPLHKRQFSLETGKCLDDEGCENLKIYPVKEEKGMVYVGIE